MRDFRDQCAAAKAGEEWNVLSTAELLDCGFTRTAIATRVRKGWLHPWHHGVYSVGTKTLTLEGLFMAAVKACGAGAVLSHYSAAALYGLVEWDGRLPEVSTPGRGGSKQRRIRVHRTTTLQPGERGHLFNIPITSPARTLIDLAATEPYLVARRAVRQALSLKLVKLHDLVAPGRRGARTLAEIISRGAAATRSDLEDFVYDFVLDAGFERPDVNQPLVFGGRTLYPDLRWPEQRLIVEIDSREWHDNQLAREDDAERQAFLEAHGEKVLRVTFRQVAFHPRQTEQRLEAAGAPYGSTRPRRIA